MKILLKRHGPINTIFEQSVYENMNVEIQQYTETALRIKFYPNSMYYEISKEALTMSSPEPVVNRQYSYNFTFGPQFGIVVRRIGTGTTVFNTTLPGLVFSEQFMQLTTKLPTDVIYGFGEHRHTQLKHDMNWRTWSIFTRDVAPVNDWNLYGAQPMYMNLEKDGKANVVFLKNSNAMEVTLQPSPYPAITYRVIGGILDFYIFLGSSPADALQQYTKAIGRSMMPPYWSLGFQLCRWHYGNLSQMREVWDRTRLAGIPQDVQWGDIDTMHDKLIFTVDKQQFTGLPHFVNELHAHGQKFIVIVDPGIGNENEKLRNANFTSPGYNMYEDGINQDVYVKDGNGKILIGKVWPGLVGYPDFTNNNTLHWWEKWIRYYRENENVSVDGLWIDMNEVSNFIYGQYFENGTEGCNRNKWNYPPYVPNILERGDGKLFAKTICMDAKHKWGRHYDVHNLYAHSMAITTYRALVNIFPGKRPMVVTRSNFAGTNKWSFHWTGDNQSQWPNLAWSITGILDYSLFGFSLVGADICGFWFEAEREMCLRWQQLGAFYPFSRNHNAHNDEGKPEFRDQDPASWDDEFTRIAREALLTRYKLLPYLYTLMHYAHTEGATVARPFVLEFPTDEVALTIDKQFLWGSGLMITPVLDKGMTKVDGYFPEGRWFDYYTGNGIMPTKAWHTLDAPMDKINLHVRGGVIIPWQEPANTTFYSRQNPMGLIVALNESQEAEGSLYWDDGESLDTFKSGKYSLLNFSAKQVGGQAGGLNITFAHHGWTIDVDLNTLELYGLAQKPIKLMVNGGMVDNNKIHMNNTMIVRVVDLHLPLNTSYAINWFLV
ncbi:hypothetical protein CHS0354_001776 [Potamilus streckersoni]|uniref:Uncharacterized protein n=1 Tax=Potamilus streckersoni TaxID=2493646 RepID=A0AAE0T1V1_9BIVA|nr:hypothetical protein CHS0354_001776 [Potamilus streckersoni]